MMTGAAGLWGQCPSFVFPHLVNGSGWRSSLYLVNESATSPVNYTLSFRGDGALPLLMPFADGRRDNQISGTIAAGGVAILDTSGLDSDPLIAGSATLSTSGTVSGFTVFREKQAGQPDREATAPLSKTAARGLVFPFDNTGGFDSSVALTVVCGPNPTVVLTAIATDEAGATLGQAEVKVTRGGHAAFMAGGEIPGTKGKQGLIRVGVAGPLGASVQLAGLGLRYSRSGALTYFPPSAWTFGAASYGVRPRSRAKK